MDDHAEAATTLWERILGFGGFGCPQLGQMLWKLSIRVIATANSLWPESEIFSVRADSFGFVST
ncbi:MAG TPA: hypothetical protein VFR81_15575, partial [Longimicrobium sp.]|nr:hypothetical protein [Longimicrobium sp.]